MKVIFPKYDIFLCTLKELIWVLTDKYAAQVVVEPCCLVFLVPRTSIGPLIIAYIH